MSHVHVIIIITGRINDHAAAAADPALLQAKNVMQMQMHLLFSVLQFHPLSNPIQSCIDQSQFEYMISTTQHTQSCTNLSFISSTYLYLAFLALAGCL